MDITRTSEWRDVQEAYEGYVDKVFNFMGRIFKEIEKEDNPIEVAEAFIKFIQGDVQVLPDNSIMFTSKTIPMLSVEVSADGSSVRFAVNGNEDYKKSFADNPMARIAWLTVVLQELNKALANVLKEVQNG